ncbi:hypothetical protein ACM66B_003101 [Microbotryomycetes sp. NB124-2]
MLLQIQQTEKLFLSALSQNRLDNFLPQWQLLRQDIGARAASGRLSAAEAQRAAAFAHAVSIATQMLYSLQGDLQHVLRAADRDIQIVLSRSEHATVKETAIPRTTGTDTSPVSRSHVLSREQWAPCTSPQQTNSEEDPRLLPYKQWFLDNFAYPYIDTDTRKQLLKLVPHHRPQQATTWFINARRRSGWSELFRQHGNSNKDVFKRVLDLADSETNKWQLDEEVRAKIDQVRSWFGRSPGGVVRAGIQSVVDRAEEIVEETQREAEQKRLEKQKVIGLGRPSRHRAHTSIPAYTTSLFEQYMPNTNVDHRNDIHSTDFFAGLLTTPPQRHVSNGSSTDSYRDYSGISPFSVDTDSTGLSSVGNSSPVSHGSAELALPPRPRVAENGDIVITPVTPQYPPQIAQSQYFTTLADWAMAQTTLA